MADSAYCWAHRPDKQEARTRNARAGGKAGGRGRPTAAGEVVEIKGILRGLAGKVLGGTLDRADAVTVNLILNTVLRCVEIERKIRETDELADRIAALEATQAEPPTRGRSWGA